MMFAAKMLDFMYARHTNGSKKEISDIFRFDAYIIYYIRQVREGREGVLSIKYNIVCVIFYFGIP